jgi:cell division protein FtsQ
MVVKMNPYIRKTLYVIAIGLLIALFVTLKAKQDEQICEIISIEIDASIEKQLVTERLVMDKYTGGLYGTEAANMPLADIESKLESMPAVLNAEVSFDLRGELTLQIEQRIPVVRIMSHTGESYYLSKDNTKIPSRGTDVARVPIANGRLTNAMITKVYTLSTYVQENAFMEALTEQIFVNKNSELVIVPKLINQQIIIGDATDLEEKFAKLIDFYEHGLNHIGWDKYHTINLKYKDQIVCN